MAAMLRQHFTPDVLQIVDDSARHAGHAGATPEGETHYRVLMVSGDFRGQSRLALGPEFAAGLHALSLNLRTPEEHAALGAPKADAATRS